MGGIVMKNTLKELNEINAAQENTEIYLFETEIKAMTKEELLLKIDVYDWTNSEKDELLSQQLMITIKNRLNLEQLSTGTPLYAVAVKNANLRLLPTMLAKYQKNRALDYWAVRRVKIGERLVVWHYDKSHNWCFVQTNNAWGWLEEKTVAYLDRVAWIGYGQADFVQIVAPLIYQATPKGEMVKLYYGTKLPLTHSYADKYQLILPKRNYQGTICFEKLYLPRDERASLGYLTLDGDNIIKQGAKFIGEKYDWGGKNGGHDCTSLISDLYGACGVLMPNNSYKQLLLPYVELLSVDLPSEKRRERIAAAHIGSVLLFKGHGMLYTGEKNGNLAILHSVYRLQEGLINQTIIGTLEQRRENGKKLLDSIEGIWDIWD